ncbi:MAG: hypothetical protein JW818_06045 [Pirellulales bacterium]|nr:hypothetical protein [Pirellulales bacterium]
MLDTGNGMRQNDTQHGILSHRAARIGVLVVLVLLMCCATVHAAPRKKSSEPKQETKTAAAPQDFRSRRFLIHTDLPAKEAQELLERLETMLTLISTYWGRPPQGIIECYVVKDLANWDAKLFPERALERLQHQAGICISQTATMGRQRFVKATVYAVSRQGVPQHESVHAYCRQAFGDVGPVWYAEGMAEMGQYWKKGGERAVNAHRETIAYLKNSPPRSLAELINETKHSGDWKDYCWWWALCHMLANNPNYGKQFRPLGLGMLTGRNVNFQQVYGRMAPQIEFEYRFFLAHMDQGFRVDLCAWDWSKRFASLKGSARIVTSTVRADRGWQPSGVRVTADTEYEYAATGKWKTDRKPQPVDADGVPEGDTKGAGRLEAVVLSSDLKLGKPFNLGNQGTFKAPADGDLYFRCHDDWCQLDDNSGTLKVKTKAQGKGKSLLTNSPLKN